MLDFHVLSTMYPCITFFQMKPTRRTMLLSIFISTSLHVSDGDRGGIAVKVLCYKSEGRWCHWNFSLT